jgi:hypothetical protein
MYILFSPFNTEKTEKDNYFSIQPYLTLARALLLQGFQAWPFVYLVKATCR